MAAQSYYQIPGVHSKATGDEIRDHFRALVKKLHPDANNGDTQGELKLKVIIEAYATLSDPKRRKEYDRRIDRYGADARPDVSTTVRIVREPVDSQAFRSIGYDPYSKTLEIEFAKGAIFRYFDVPSSLHSQFISADSKGTFYRERIASQFRERAMKR